jgi:hypothetical protein
VRGRPTGRVDGKRFHAEYEYAGALPEAPFPLAQGPCPAGPPAPRIHELSAGGLPAYGVAVCTGSPASID